MAPGRLFSHRLRPAFPPHSLADGLVHSGRSPRGRGCAAAAPARWAVTVGREALRDGLPASLAATPK